MVAFSRVLFSTQILSLTKQITDTLRPSFSQIFNVGVPSFMNFSRILKYQVHLASVRPRIVYHILYPISLLTLLENLVGISLGAQKLEMGSVKKGCCHAFL